MSLVVRHAASSITAAVAGATLVCAFSPFSYWWLTFICPVLLYAISINRAPWHAFLPGFIFGLCFFGFGVAWTFNSIHEFGYAPVLLSAFLAGLLVLVLSLFPACATYLFSVTRCNARVDFIGALIFATLWSLFEWLRGWVFTGFPWLLIGHVHHSTPLHGVIPVFGTYGATWLTLLIGCFGAVVIGGQLRQKTISGIALVVIVVALAIANKTIWTHADDEELSVALVQGNVSEETKWDQMRHPYIMDKHLELSKDYLDVDIIVWPETAIPTYYTMAKEFVGKLEAIVDARGVEFLVGVFTSDPDNGKIYNSVIVAGEEPGLYQKRHLVPFGEYMPLRGLTTFLDRYIQIPMADLSSAEGRPLVRLKGYHVGISICYEAVYGSTIIDAMPEAKFLINVSNDAWFGDSLAPHQHLEITRSRAIETGRYLLRATNTGISAIVDPNGMIVAKSAQFQEDVVRAKIQPYTGLTPFSRWGNWGIVIILCGIFFIICPYQWQQTARNKYQSFHHDECH